MRILLSILSLLFLSHSFSQTFLAEQCRYSRVRAAIKEYEDTLSKELEKFNCYPKDVEIYLRGLKYEEKLEVWVKSKRDTVFHLFKTIPFCVMSGQLGPKRKQGDGQIPEGLYYIDRFNPSSNFHLSLGLNYPNKSDRIRGMKGNLGGDIFIHGNCVTIGCISITDPIISQVYLLSVWAKNNGQRKIPVHIYPFMMKKDYLDFARKKLYQFKDFFQFWVELEVFYKYFERHRIVPEFTISEEGEYLIQESEEEND